MADNNNDTVSYGFADTFGFTSPFGADSIFSQQSREKTAAQRVLKSQVESVKLIDRGELYTKFNKLTSDEYSAFRQTLPNEYSNSFGIDMWNKESFENLTHVRMTLKGTDVDLTKDEYINKFGMQPPPPYQKGWVYLCIMPQGNATFKLQLLSLTDEAIQFGEDDYLCFAADNYEHELIKFEINKKQLPIVQHSVSVENERVSKNHSLQLWTAKSELFNNAQSANITIQLGDKKNKKPFIILDQKDNSSRTNIPIYHKRGKTGVLKQIGMIVLHPNVPLNINVRTVTFLPFAANGRFTMNREAYFSSIEKYFQQKSFNQTGIFPLLKREEKIELNSNDLLPYLNLKVQPNRLQDPIISNSLKDEDSNEIDTNGNVLRYNNHIDKLMDIYIKKREQKITFKGIIIFLVPFEFWEKDGVLPGQAKGIPEDARYLAIYVLTAYEGINPMRTITHEVAHVLGLNHSFYELKGNPIPIFKNKLDNIIAWKKQHPESSLTTHPIIMQYNINTKLETKLNQKINAARQQYLFFKKGTTLNFMDYKDTNEDYTFFFWQWQVMRNEAIRYYADAI